MKIKLCHKVEEALQNQKDKVDDDGISQDELDSLSEDEQAGIGYNPNNPRGDVGSPRPIYSDDDTENSSEDE
ncbi:hypothetical protein ACWTWI_07260 [Staphylococcus hominis]